MTRDEDVKVITQSGRFVDPEEASESLATTGAAGSITQATNVAAAAALTSSQITGGQSPTEAEYNALQADVDALRTKLNALLAAITGTGKAMSA